MFVTSKVGPLVVCVCAVAAATLPSATIESICPSKTINYLTHTLPQQCLTASRTSAASVTADDALAEPSVTASATSKGQTLYSAVDATDSLQDRPQLTSSTESEGTEKAYPVTTVTATLVSSGALVPALPTVVEEDSPLESDSFMSFEEWKKQNLQKAGQSEHIGRDTNYEPEGGRKRPTNLHNSLDSLGDDAEIDLDFHGFAPVGPGSASATDQATPLEEAQDASHARSNPRVKTRSKDAGTTCKERFNYASFDCAANVLKTNREAKSPTSVLSEYKDAYMLNECSAENKFLILELCQDLLIDTIVLANFEFFSSTFRLFRVSLSDRYPVRAEKWKEVGTFEARNTREVQAFLVENPVIWARYVRIEFLSHYGSEYYCPLSLVRVHGTTMMEEYKHDIASATSDEDEEAAETATSPEETLVPEAVDEKMLKEALDRRAQQDASRQFDATSSPPSSVKIDSLVSNTSLNPLFDAFNLTAFASSSTCPSNDSAVQSSYTEILTESILANESSVIDNHTVISLPENIVGPPMSTDAVLKQPTASPVISETNHSSPSSMVSLPASSSYANSTTTTVPPSSSSGNRANSSEQVQSSQTSPPTKHKTPPTGTQSQPASPTVQESFFKSVQKRLQQLESNSSLSLQYIEEQSRSLRDAFRKVEQRQLSKTSFFLDQLNMTVLSELREFRLQYDQLWQSTVIELEQQRKIYQRENQAINARLAVLADELIFQKRIGILQMLLIIVCLGLVLFSRGAINNYLELPLVQSVFSRSPSTRVLRLHRDTPGVSPKLARPRSAHEIGSAPGAGVLKGHRRGQSTESISNTEDNLSAPEARAYSPPTPVSYDGYSDAEQRPQA